MTGCTDDSTGYFGTAGRYVLKLGEDMFGTGKQGIVGGDLPTEPQGNEEGLIFYNYDVKEVDKAPKDEKTAYNLDGPENSGIVVPAAPAVTLQPAQPGSAVESGTKIVLTSGHCLTGNADYEFVEDQLYFKAAANFIYCVTGSTPGDSGKVKLKQCRFYKRGTVMGDLCKRAGQEIKSGDNGDGIYKKIAVTLARYGFVKNNKLIEDGNSVYLKASVGSLLSGTINKDRRIKFYKKYSKKLDGFVQVMNEARKENTKLWSGWGNKYCYRDSSSKVDTSVVPSNRNTWAGGDSGIFFKAKATAGGSASVGGTSIPEYELNYLITTSLAKKLAKEGYTVIRSKQSKNTQQLQNGTEYSNKNISLFAAEKQAVLHIVVHCDSSGSSKGGHLIVPSKDVSSVAEGSRKAAEAFKDKAGSGVLRSHNKINVTDGYTTTNFAEVPTILMECFNMDSNDECNKFLEVKDGKVTLKEKAFWGSDRFNAVLAAIEAVDK